MGMPFRTVFAAILLWPLGVLAQPLSHTVFSLEALALNSQYICVGRILKLETPSHINATVQVETVFKIGEMVGKMGLLVSGSRDQLERWQKSNSRLLIFDQTTVDLDDPQLEMIDADGRFLRSPEAILAAVRRVTEENPGVFGMQTARRTDIPWAKSRQAISPGRYPVLIVPADRKFERRCYSTIAHSKNPHDRATAARNLALFPSERAIATLKKLLSDPGTIEQPPGKHWYIVRQTAWETLRLWDDTIPKPAEYRTEN
jgi:hypothetical protein